MGAMDNIAGMKTNDFVPSTVLKYYARILWIQGILAERKFSFFNQINLAAQTIIAALLKPFDSRMQQAIGFEPLFCDIVEINFINIIEVHDGINSVVTPVNQCNFFSVFEGA